MEIAQFTEAIESKFTPDIKNLLRKRKLTGKELGVLLITDLVYRLQHRHADFGMRPLVSNEKYQTLTKYVNSVQPYKDEFKEYKIAYDVLLLQDTMATQVVRSTAVALNAYVLRLNCTFAAETYRNGDILAGETFDTLTDDSFAFCLALQTSINEGLYFLTGYNYYITEISKKLEVPYLLNLQKDITKLEPVIYRYDELRNELAQLVSQDKDASRRCHILFPALPMRKELNVERVLQGKTLIDEQQVFQEGYANPVFHLFTSCKD